MGYQVSDVYNRFRLTMNASLPVLLLTMLILTGVHWKDVSDGWGHGRDPDQRPWENSRHKGHQWKAWHDWAPWVEALGWLYAALPLLLVLAAGVRTIFRLRRRGQLTSSNLLRPRTQWGPSEIRFWEGRYKHLQYDHGIVLDEEKDLQRILLRMGKRRLGSHASRGLPEPPVAKKAPKVVPVATAPTPSPSALTAPSAPTPLPSKESSISPTSKKNK